MEILCRHQMPKQWCATCREEKEARREREANVSIYENFKEWTNAEGHGLDWTPLS